ncbi:MAG: phage tail sheath family protein [Rhizobacter sp.]|nr:phage tail sheath family protein [Rhizobacter sp.]
MPVALTYPGVYVEEVPSGVRTIAGVATSITAFVGRARRGPADDDVASPVRVYSFADFERSFGGLWNDSPMSHAVYHYFQNGGAEALIVRVHNGAETAAAGDYAAANPGAWGTRLRLRFDTDIDPDVAAANPANTLFNLRVKDLATGVTETHLNVSITAGARRYVGDVLRQSSSLVSGPTGTIVLPTPSLPPAATATDPFDDPTSLALTAAATADGDPITSAQVSAPGLRATKQGFYALEKADLFNLLCLPPFSPVDDVDKSSWDAAVTYARERRALVLVDPPFNTNPWTEAADVTQANAVTDVAARSPNAAVFFPRIRVGNPLRENRPEPFAPCGALAGVFARTDSQRGVWKAPAGLEATLSGVLGLDVNLTDPENGSLNPLGVNCLRHFPNTGPTVWGARTLHGADALASEWKYIPVRRTALYIEESLFRGTKWVVFEPNDEPLWAQIRLNVGAFLQNMFRQGAFQGRSPKEAYFVRCDSSTTTQTDINNGVVNIIVGFAPLKPAEFVVIKLQQIAGDIPV